jgi:hypothetical protein
MMRNVELALQYAIFILSAIILGQSVVYFIMRAKVIFDSFGSQEYITLLLLSFYLFLVIIWSVLVLSIRKENEIFHIVYGKLSLIIGVLSLIFFLAFYSSYIPYFQPYEFVYFMHEISVLAFLMGVLCSVTARLMNIKEVNK